MKPGLVLQTGTVIVLTGAVFALDLITPQAWAVPILYLLPLFLSYDLSRPRLLFELCFLATLLSVAGYVLSPPALDVQTAQFNRITAISVLWGAAIVMQSRRRAVALATVETERRKRGMEQAAEQFQLLVESAPSGLLLVDQTGRITLVNQVVERLFGYERAELIGQPVEVLVPEPVRPGHVVEREQFMRESSARRMGEGRDLHGRRKDGSVFPVEIGLNPIQTPEGLRVLAVVVDITERKQAELLLRQREEQYRRLVEVSPVAILINRGDRVVFINDQAVKLFGAVGPEPIIGKSLFDLFHPDGHTLIRERIHRLVEGIGVVPLVEERIIRLDGSTADVEVTAARFVDHEGVAIQVVLRDITDRKQAEAALRASEERFKAFMDHSPAMAYMKDEQGRYVYMNEPLERLLCDQTGRESVDWEGKTDEAFWPAETARQFRANDREVLAANKPLTRMEQTTDPRGIAQHWLSFKFPLVDPQGTKYLAGVSVNVTEEKRLEAQLRRTERIAELGTLASGMAHEIGTPMNVILGRAEYLLQKTSDESMKKGLSTIITQVERITRVMNQLLAFARRKPRERCPVDLKELIEDGLDMFHERLSRQRIAVEQTVDESLPTIVADRDQLMQVLINLIVNSLHAMDQGGTLRLVAAKAGHQVLLEISDTGQGIPPDVLSKVFDPFFTTKEFGKGTGLGLTVVKGIVEEHGGTISVGSRVGEGTTITILLPLDPDRKPAGG
ncbi:MAG TPA: PAS domain S-box protein [Nitrospiraceae bacterium]|nr:PAS domain S-box protein [Nitrospiraceae bacterium]